jgi:hypothetical protein
VPPRAYNAASENIALLKKDSIKIAFQEITVLVEIG